MSRTCDLLRGWERAGFSPPAQTNPGRYQAKAFPGPETTFCVPCRGRAACVLWEECGIPAFLRYRIVSTSHDYSKGSKQVLVLVVKPVLYFIIQPERVFSFSTESSRTAPCPAGRWCWFLRVGFCVWNSLGWDPLVLAPSKLELMGVC